MNKEQYLITVHEQVQAYGYEPVEIPAESPVNSVYLNEDKGGKKWKAVVAIMDLGKESVGQVREASEKARKVVKSHIEVKVDFWSKIEKVICYLLLIPPSISKQMEIYVEEGHDTIDADDMFRAESWLYPILVGIEDQRLVYRESSGLKKMYLQYTLENEVEKLFQV